ncbi:CENPH protein, partial [Picathartes gymnocephalus]|nr:CENPH protein [Picathartes gymnocephalus]
HMLFLTLCRVQIMDALRNKVIQEDEDSRLILDTMKQIVLLSQTIIEYQQFYCSPNYLKLNFPNNVTALKKDGGQKLEQIQAMMKRQEEKQANANETETEMILAKLEGERQMTTVIQNVFQNIIIGSRVNWAEDPSLKAIVLQLEKDVCLQ